MSAAVTGAIREHGTAQQRRAGIEAAAGIADHPAPLPETGISRLALQLHQQGNSAEFIAACPQLVAVMALQHQVAALPDHQPATRLGHLLQFQALQQAVATGLKQLNTRWAQGLTSCTVWGVRLENPQLNSRATRASRSHSGGTSSGSSTRSTRRIPTNPTAR